MKNEHHGVVKKTVSAVAEALNLTERKPAPVSASPEPAPEPPLEQAPPQRRDEPTGDPIVADPKLNPRNRVMEEVAERRRAELAAETTPSEVAEFEPAPGTESAADPDAAPDPEYTDPNPQPAPAQPAAAAPAAAPQAEPGPVAHPPTPQPAPAGTAPAGPAEPTIDPNAEYTFMVDGRPVKIRGSQVVARVQKNEAADQRLQAASQILMDAQRQAQPAPLPAQGPQPGTPTAASVKSDADLAHDLQFGTQDQAATAIAEIRRRDANAVTQEGLQQFVARQLPALMDDQLDVRDTAKFIRNEFGDLMADPYLEQLFKGEFVRLRQAGDTRSRMDLSKHIGDSLRTHFNRPKPNAAAPQPPTPAAPSIEQRREAKKSAPPAPRLASVRMDGDAQPTLTPEQERARTIEAMRKRTGGHQQAGRRA